MFWHFVWWISYCSGLVCDIVYVRWPINWGYFSLYFSFSVVLRVMSWSVYRKITGFSFCVFWIQWTRQFRVIDSSGSTLEKDIYFFPNGIVFRYYPVIFSNLLAAWNVMMAVETWPIDVLITKCLTAPLHGKVKVPANYLHVTAKTSIWSHNFSKPCINNIYICR